jgi:epsin
MLIASSQYFNEIMPSIYSRFMEKEARQWRQIYKVRLQRCARLMQSLTHILQALQLLEYLIKHGSERVVDDARSHISTIKMLRNFHYHDDKGKDEGLNGRLLFHSPCFLYIVPCLPSTLAYFLRLLSLLLTCHTFYIHLTDHRLYPVRNRARELVELLSDVDKIRQERRKAKANKHKYVGTGNDGMGMDFSSGGSRYGGFGSDSLGGGGESLLLFYGGSYVDEDGRACRNL